MGGTVVDQSGAAVPDAAVRVENTQTGVSRGMRTNQEGSSSFPLFKWANTCFAWRRPDLPLTYRKALLLRWIRLCRRPFP
ncbi:MAG: carboxypeptidase-like regulatory domain-containing protein [Bryobacteraceae bacterium]